MLFPPEEIKLNIKEGDISYYPKVFNETEAFKYFNTILKETNWNQDNITVYGKTYPQPRLTALFANNQKPYSYSNITMYPESFSKTLLKIKHRIETIAHEEFTTCLANLYRHGLDSNGWHSDNEKELGRNPIIASVSFGEERTFSLKHKNNKNLKHKLVLEHGSLLIMKGETQNNWLHQIAKTKRKIKPRINLTFRIIK
ncbi:alpha-ketoglutarate-dependent dioxygenase AlkB [uncultured Lacinutrix sp.]|uniref:alpha-ketoglutarate-dependent dioxygenase AlkB family protein n=1 Tax=uncultured Lacinutrix sp. TaxID=574032 RepID=UPI00262E3698|nr:alpha-ketoglutarate-dependent dioxygenase AlkB [uncultured Lacinutrix sp.]